jgi:hypothetical protein
MALPSVRRRLRRVVLLLLAVLVLASLLAVPAAAARPAASAIGPAVPRLDWADCGDGFQCATGRGARPSRWR